MQRKFFYLFFIIVFGHIESGYAFFQVEECPKELRIEHTTKESATQDNIAYYFYDNSISKSLSFFLLKKNDKCIFFDQIEINIPLRMLSKNVFKAEDSMDRMLTSNLRIKQILSDYKKIQNRADSIMKNNGVITTETRDRESFEISKKNIDFINNELRKLQNAIINLTRSSIAQLGYFDTGGIITYDSHINPGQYADDNLYPQNLQTRQQRPDAIESNYKIDSKTMSNPSDSHLPGIIDFFLKLIRNIMGNRVEIMLFTMFLMLIGLLVSLKVRK